MGDIPGTYDPLRERRIKALRNFIISICGIIAGLMVFFMIPITRMFWFFLLIPTFFGSYAIGQFVRDWVLIILVDKAFETEDADLYAMAAGVIAGLFGSVALAAGQYLIVLIFVGIAMRPIFFS